MEERLKKLTKLVDYGSFTHAAAQLHTSQPALSVSIQKLERELGGKLLQRSAKKLTLTPLGVYAYTHGMKLLELERTLLAQTAVITNQKQQFRFGCIDSIADLVARHNLLAPIEVSCNVSVVVHNSSLLLTELERGELDMVIIVSDAYSKNSTTTSEKVGSEPFVLLCNRQDVAAVQYNLNIGIIENFLAYNISSTTYQLLNNQLLQQGITVHPRLSSTNPSVLYTLAEQGKGTAALPASTRIVTDKVDYLQLPQPLSRGISRVWRKDALLPTVIDPFMESLKKYIDS